MKVIGEGWIAALGFLALAAVNLMLWPVDYPPLIDWPNHLARHSIQCDAGAPLARYYVYEFTWVPNLTAELVHLLPWACNSLLTTQKILIQFATTGLLASAMILHFAVWRRWSVWPLMVAFVTHHMAFAYGFENYVLAMPLVLLGLAVWFARSPTVRLLALLPVAGVIYICHVYAFAFFFGALVLLELGDWWRGRILDLVRRMALLGLVALGPTLHLLAVTTSTAGVEPGVTEFGGLLRRLTVGLSPFTAVGQPYLDSGILRVAALQLTAMALIWGVARSRFGSVIHPGTGLAALGMFVVTILIPGKFLSVALTDIRFPVLAVCLLVAVSDVRFSRAAAVGFAFVIVVSALFRTLWLEGRWAVHDAEVRELLAAGAILAPGDRMLVARTGEGWDVLLHSHSASHLARDIGLFVPDVFTGGNALAARDDFAARDAFQPYPVHVSRLVAEVETPRGGDLTALPGDSRYWARWPEFFTHVLVLRAEDRPASEYAELGIKVAEGRFFAIYETGLVSD